MNLKFWKHRHSQEVIDGDCYKKLPASHQTYYSPTKNETATHKVEEDDGGNFLNSLITSSIISNSYDSTPSVDYGSSSSDMGSSSNDFGGGDGGGGGASGDY